jgi:hypothetical protein
MKAWTNCVEAPPTKVPSMIPPGCMSKEKPTSVTTFPELVRNVALIGFPLLSTKDTFVVGVACVPRLVILIVLVHSPPVLGQQILRLAFELLRV